MKILEIVKKKVDSTPNLKSTNEENLRNILAQKISSEAIFYCLGLWKETPFSFVLTKKRSSCFGNYTYKDGHHKITINNDLNPYAFVLTYVHEVAHLRAWLKNSRKKIQPHGKEWKQTFQILMQPILNSFVFPEEILQPLQNYMADPAASSVSHSALAAAMQKFDLHQDSDGELLSEIEVNEVFIFRDKVFRKIQKRRTRVLCEEEVSKRRFTILGVAKVKRIS